MNLLFALLIAFSGGVVSCGGTIFIGSIFMDFFTNSGAYSFIPMIPFGAIIGLIIGIIIMTKTLASKKRNTTNGVLTTAKDNPSTARKIFINSVNSIGITLVMLIFFLLPSYVVLPDYTTTFYINFIINFLILFIIIYPTISYLERKRFAPQKKENDTNNIKNE